MRGYSHFKWERFIAAGVVLLALCGAAAAQSPAGVFVGTIKDEKGGAVADAEVWLLDALRFSAATARTDPQGRFELRNVPRGSYLLVIRKPGFAERREQVTLTEKPSLREFTLGLEPVYAQVTVTAVPGLVEDRMSLAQAVNVLGSEKIEQRSKSVVAQVALEEPGLALQRTSPTISGIYVRGLTGNKVNVFVDGVRYSTSAARGGINTFLNLIDASSLDSVEILRGPNSAQYGSDAIGGSVQFQTRMPWPYGDHNWRGSSSTFFNSADAGFGSNFSLSYAGRNWAFSSNLAGRRLNTLRTGGSRDSHSALTRFLGISSRVLYDRLPGTAFTQYGGMLRFHYTPATNSNFTVNYLRGQQDGGRRHDQLLGGDGNLIADLRNLMNDFFYARFDQVRALGLDLFSLTYSYNAQREERVNQGGQGNPAAAITFDPERLAAHGIQAHAAREWHPRLQTTAGVDFYRERIRAISYQKNPLTGVDTLRRGRVPHNALYKSGGAYLQGIFTAWPQRLRLTGSLRYSAASYRVSALDAPVPGLWPNDSLRVSDWTGRAGIVWTPLQTLSLSGNFSRGFRAPHITDLGTLGLTGSGFEVAAPDVQGLGATVGTSASSTAVSTGQPVTQARSETSWTYEFGARFRTTRFETEFSFFVNDFFGNLEKAALILPPGAVGLLLGGQPIVAQNPNGTVFVAASANPVLVRHNLFDARIKGIEHDLEWKFLPSWAVRTVFTWLHAAERSTGRPPDIEGGTPAPDFWLKIRYAPAHRPFWLEPYLHAAGRQSRLSSLDLTDRRTGAERTRSSIANFFNRGARVRGLISPGADNTFGTADDFLIATNETLVQVQDRVLGVGVNSSSLFTAVPGYAVFGLRGGVRIGERHELFADFENIGDRNYRGISWGVDAPGRGLSIRYSFKF
jgi:outer membrane receptor protein involved in Fe transport